MSESAANEIATLQANIQNLELQKSDVMGNLQSESSELQTSLAAFERTSTSQALRKKERTLNAMSEELRHTQDERQHLEDSNTKLRQK